VLFCININAQSNQRPSEQTEFILKLINDNPTNFVKVVGTFESKSYGEDWLQNIQVVDGFLVFTRDDEKQEKHYWYVENVGFIQTYHTAEGFVVRLDLREKSLIQ
jgi:hypothetical protein